MNKEKSGRRENGALFYTKGMQENLSVESSMYVWRCKKNCWWWHVSQIRIRLKAIYLYIKKMC